MADATTAIYQFVLPEVGASDDTWGTKLNADFTKLETLFVAAFDGGTPAALGKLKPTMFGSIVLDPASGIPAITFDGNTTTHLADFNIANPLDALAQAFRFGRLSPVGNISLVLYNPGTTTPRVTLDSTGTGKVTTGIGSFGSFHIGALPDGTVNAGYISGATGTAFNFRSGVDTSNSHLFRRANGTVVGGLDLEGATAPAQTYTIVTREKGDARYVNLGGAAVNSVTRIGDVVIGGIPTGAADANAISAITGQILILRGGTDTSAMIQFLNATGTEVGRFEAPGTAIADAQAIVTLEKGDARYANLSGGVVPVATGGTGAPDAATARTNLGANSATNLTAGTLPAARLGATAADETWVLARCAGAPVGAVGTYAMLWNEAATNLAAGATLAGSSLSYTGVNGTSTTSTSPSGTWQLMGDTDVTGTQRISVWLRIS